MMKEEPITFLCLSVDVQNFQNKGTVFHETLHWEFLLKFVIKFQSSSKLTKYLWDRLNKNILCPLYFFSKSYWFSDYGKKRERGKSSSLRGGRTQSGIIVQHERRLLLTSTACLIETLLLNRIILPEFKITVVSFHY